MALTDLAKSVAGETISTIVGRRNLARAARFLTNVARLDGPNDMLRNGETLVQETIIRQTPENVKLIVFDAGANTGLWTSEFISRSKFRDYAVHAFEPVAATASLFRSNVSDPAVTLTLKALSDRSGKAKMAVHAAGGGTNALIPEVGAAVEYFEDVVLTTLDEYCEQVGVDRIDLLKIDAEGHDMFILLGGRSMFSRRRIAAAQFEYNHRWIWSRAFLRDAFEFGGEYGYRVAKVTRRGLEFYRQWDKELEKFQEGNYILCREDWVERFPQVQWWGD